MTHLCCQPDPRLEHPMRATWSFILILFVFSCARTNSPEVAPPAEQGDAAETADPDDAIARAVASTERPAEDRARDAARKPAAVLRFFEVREGQRVADLMAGKGYYTELLALAVGPRGQVVAQNNEFVVAFAGEPLSERLNRLGMPHVTQLANELDALSLPQDLDAVLMVLFYHDTYWQNVDRAAMNRAIFDALRPGGVFGIVDHHAVAGSGSEDVKTLHRVDAELVKREILAAGFTLEAESDVLSHPDDDRTKNVFEPEVRGKTDRFTYRFRKPL